MAVILDGKETAKEIKSELKDLIWRSQLSPKLSIIQGGDRPDSNQYVRNKIRACQEVGIEVVLNKIVKDDNYIDNLKEAVLEANKTSDGVIVQLPIPDVTPEMQRSILELIDKDKDVDCLRLDSEGAFYATQNNQLAPCTPMGIMTLLKHYSIKMNGKKVCILGRSKIVGKPLAELMVRENATVTICHSKTPEEVFCREVLSSNIVISAVGCPNLISAERLSRFNKDFNVSRLTFIDVGTNFVDGKWCGDVSQDIKDACYAYSPVPGGVGPMTIVSLLQKVVSRCLINNYS